MSKIQTNQIQHTQNGAAVFTLPTADGSNGQFLKTNASGVLSFATPTDTNTDTLPDYVKLQRATGGGGANLTFDNLDVATYKIFDFWACFVPESDAYYPYFRFRTGGASGSDISSGAYGYGYRETYPNNNGGNISAHGQNEIRLHGSVGNNTNNGEGFRINIRMFFADSSDNGSTPRLGNFISWGASRHDGNSDYRSATGNGAYNADNSTYPTGFTIFMGGGAINAQSYALYGLKR
tara:strand:- start:352 stop:1059 length:708 start_codon:yes stop_codon:yes gene_type:complete